MTDIEKQIEELSLTLQDLRNRHLQMNEEIFVAKQQLQQLKDLSTATQVDRAEGITENTITALPAFENAPKPYIQAVKERVHQKTKPLQPKTKKTNQEFEDFIGTNVISKVGILITIIGVFIGAKYAIDNELISPLMRIIAGYAVGAALIFLALKLKPKYLYFSSILIGGGLAITYFITYIAFSFYGLMPQSIAFVAMVFTTVFAVAIALWYNQKVIALLGQVAAYAIPFLLGDSKGNVFVLFSYISLINVGLLVLSLKKDWKILYHIAFFLSWLIYGYWIFESTEISKSFTGGIVFLTINFLTFYATFLAYKIVKKEQYEISEIGILLFNALFFFFCGTSLIRDTFTSIHILTWFTIANAAIHFAAGYIIYRLKLADKTVFQFITGLGILFITVAIPIELDGNWVTLLWTIEATTLFYIAYKNTRQLYLDLTVPLLIVAVSSLLQDWYTTYPFLSSAGNGQSFATIPFINFNFYLSLFVAANLCFISYLMQKSKLEDVKRVGVDFFKKLVPLGFLILLYFTLHNEIHYLWDQKIDSNEQVKGVAIVHDLQLFQSLTLIIYSILFLAAWLFINQKWIKREDFHYLLIVFSLVVTAVFISKGSFNLGELREDYVAKNGLNPFVSALYIRYIAFGAIAVLWLNVWNAMKAFKPGEMVTSIISLAFNITLLFIISNEFIHWMDLEGYQNQYKLGLSLICGGYALALVFVGIVKKKKRLRIFAIVLFAITLLKLFFYDLSSLSTISKTIVLVLLGVLLLFASFLYNKYKDLLFDKEEVYEK